MNCREFRRQHDAYIDDTLMGTALEGMARHVHFCERCAQHDTRIRRALMVARNVPMIQPSVDFGARLEARLLEERSHIRRTTFAPTQFRTMTGGTYLVIAAGVLMLAGLAGILTLDRQENEPVRMAPMVASAPATELAAPTMIAAMPAGMPLWPAVLLAQQAPWHFANAAAGR